MNPDHCTNSTPTGTTSSSDSMMTLLTNKRRSPAIYPIGYSGTYSMALVMHLPILWMMTQHLIFQARLDITSRVYLCVLNATHLRCRRSQYMAPSELNMDELKARKTDSDPLEVSRRSLITSNTARSFCMWY
jgi:hypothetical protein